MGLTPDDHYKEVVVMNDDLIGKGNFTLPGEAGYEDLTLQLAEKWGADAIRDSDGTVLSDEIISTGFSIYSTRY